MSAPGPLGRLRAVWRTELRRTLRRPMFATFAVVLVLLSLGMTTGNVSISSGAGPTGGEKEWLTSEFNVAELLAIICGLMYPFFLAIAAGMSAVEDDRAKVRELLHATPLKPAEYAWGKYLGIFTAFLAILTLHLGAMVLFFHIVPNAAIDEVRGPFSPVNYLRPAWVFAMPLMVFFTGAAFYLGERYRRPMPVFALPILHLLATAFFFIEWTPPWLDPRIDRLLMCLDPTGGRWLDQTWTAVDRGVAFYNHTPVSFDGPFVLSRLGFAILGLAGVALAARHVGRSAQRRSTKTVESRGFGVAGRPVPAELTAPLAEIVTCRKVPGFAAGVWLIARGELRALVRSPGFYIFGVLILVLTLGEDLSLIGPYGTDLLLTPGQIAVATLDTLTTLLALLLLFYTVEALDRERGLNLHALSYSTPLSTPSIVLGKTAAAAMLGLSVILATLLGSLTALVVQGEVALSLMPFGLVWGLLLIPTVLVWISFVATVHTIGGNRYLSYGVALGALAFTSFRQSIGELNWVSNWPLWDVLRWSDMSLLEIDRRALVLNRLFFFALAVFFTAVTVRALARRQRDAVTLSRLLQPATLLRGAGRFFPWAAAPLLVGVVLWLGVAHGYQSEAVERRTKDYWRQNIATWRETPFPTLATVDLDLEVEPAERWFRSRGTFMLENRHDFPLQRFVMTGGDHWRELSWTLDGEPYEPEDRSRLYVFTPAAPLRPGEQLEVGFAFEGRFLDGLSKNGGVQREFILPSGVVLNNFSPIVTPVWTFVEGIGVTEDNRYDPRDYPDDFYEQDLTDAVEPFDVRVRITAPAEYTMTSVGVRTSDVVDGDSRTVVWESDHPVRGFNILGGRWAERRGEGTAIFYHPEHDYNIDEMVRTLDAARRYYSEWFHPYPWRELRLSEFPNLSPNAQGWPTNINFSEGIGFLTRSQPGSSAVMMITAHEAAHQWWGNIVNPGDYPGGEVLSEGMSHFSAVLLTQALEGEWARMELLKNFETFYARNRRLDSEVPLVEARRRNHGHSTVIYEKGGWVFWMLLRHMGREAMLEGVRHFIVTWKDSRDAPVLQDFIETMRPFAPDPEAYDDFADQWFFDVVLPEIRLRDTRRFEGTDGWQVVATIENVGSGRVPLSVAAIAGARFGEAGAKLPGYLEARRTITLGPGEARELRILTDFEPESVIVDPDVEVLQLRRPGAVSL